MVKISNEQTTSEQPLIFYCYITTPLGELLAVQGEKGLQKLFFPCDGTRFAVDQQGWIEDPERMQHTADELCAYFNKDLEKFSIPLDPKGTPFQRKVWQSLMSIPFGTTVSYKDIAERTGNPKGCRAVGGAVGQNPVPIIIPCHRVIGKNGSLTGFSSGLAIKRYLLDLEGAL
ncbi:MAG: methylated-DNA--[protein]-cysteine S-methyltransferase [Desulfamplus sp.]|nr:methylated-DNA--[protein]-cysteine S-methyltransferase [Desulfamplus sp.]